ncbi:MarR family winged helix-turn-helix transcriptional regulator [Paenibacillus sp. CF384]|uniref:MarR family winged helix-turn-helix transcriptional regulator n=1 Tax=Paenibacillus sp. CF384 TaxID=1884382 RepID=UPI00089483E5|nr:MarR family transcriptional regulator [Paenibacillus sp. CF384]SDX48946.1 DNA-binding transcriptional regulator, MarR family [Paenibacillus sp. CF384]
MSTESRKMPFGFAMGLTYRKLAALFQQRLSAYGITPEQWSALNQIDCSQGLIQREIAQRIGKDKPSMTRILDHLEKKGLIYKKAGDRDRRSFLVYSTELGREIIRVTTPIEESITAEVKACLSEEEHDNMIELLQRVQLHIEGKLKHTDC